MMKNIAPHPLHKNRKDGQSGNIFFMLFASIALIGAMTAGAGNIVKGLVTSMSDVTRKTVAEEKMQGAARISIQNASLNQPTDGDCDADGMVEPLPYRDAAGKPAPVGGGLVPLDIGATVKDPWGNEYGYCVWNPQGPDAENAGCGVTPNRLRGGSDPSDTVVAIISAGRDRRFSTSCAAYVDPGVGAADCTGKGDLHYNDPVSGHCYFREPAVADWATQAANCAAEGGYLASITSNAEQALITANIGFAQGMYIGMFDTVEGDWKYTGGELAGTSFWSGDQTGSPVGGQYSNWAALEPNNDGGNEDCGQITGYTGDQWNDEICSNPWAGLCEVSGTVSGGPSSSPLVARAPGGDDLVMEYTYADAQGLSGDDLWKIKDTKPGTAVIDKDIDVTGRAEFTGPLNLINSGLILPGDDPGYVCDATSDQQLRINYTNNPALLEICDFTGGNGWVAVSMGGGGGVPTCSAGYTLEGSRCYKENPPGPDWAGARSACQADGGDLATINNVAEHNWLKTFVSDEAYIGLSDAALEGTFVWLDTSSTYQAWSTGEPNDNFGEDCGTIWPTGNPPGDFADTACANTIHYSVCEKAATNGGGGGGTTPADCTGMGSEHFNDAASGHCYFVGDSTSDWNGAVSYCQANNAYLASITSGTENTAMTGGLNVYTMMWLGMNDQAVEGDWIYSTGELAGTQFWLGNQTGSPVGGNYNSWHSGEPENDSGGGQHCGSTGYGGEGMWDDAYCSNPYPPICERSPTGGASGGYAPPPGLVARWRMDEISGTTLVDSVGGHNAILQDASAVPTTGVRDGAITFNGSSTVAVYNGTPLIPAEFTAAVWVKTPAPSQISSDWTSILTSGGDLHMHWDSPSGLRCEVPDGAYNLSPDNSFGTANTWHHVVCTHDGSTLRMYIDGLLVGSEPATITGGTSSEFVIGAENPTYGFLNSNIDDVMVFDRALTQEEITDMYSASDLDYDAGGDGGGGTPTPDTSAFLVSPNSPQCTSAQTGPPKRTGISDVTNFYQYMAKGKDNYFFTIGDTTGVSAFRSNGDGTITRITTQSSGGGNSGAGIFADDNYIYVNNYNHNLVAFTFDGTTLTQVGSINTPANGTGVTKHQNFVVVGDDTALIAYSFNGTTFTQVATYAANGATTLFSDGTYIYYHTTSDNKINVVTFNGTAFTPVTDVTLSGGAGEKIMGNGQYLYAITATSLLAYRFDGTTITLVDSMQTGLYNMTALGTDGVNIYIAELDDRIHVVRMESDLLTAVSTYDLNGLGGVTYDILSDGSFLYVSTANGPLQVYSGMACYADGSAPDGHAQPSGNPLTAKISVGSNSACGVKRGGSVWCWGVDGDGQLGNAAMAGNQVSPSRVDDTRAYSQVSVGTQFACGVKSNGVGACWGDDYAGRIGNGAPTVDQPAPFDISTYLWSKIAVGAEHACGISDTGQMYCWGSNVYGELGTGNNTNRNVPTAISLSTERWTDITAGNGFSCGVTVVGQMYCWGNNDTCQIGDGERCTTNATYNTPQSVNDSGPWVSVSAGDDTICGIKTDGTAWCWGYMLHGIAGNGNVMDTLTYAPSRIADPGPWMRVSLSRTADTYTGCGIKQNGQAYCWGQDQTGSLGNGSDISEFGAPTAVFDPGPWADISTNNGVTCGLKLDGSAWCWGTDANGRLGNGAGYTGQQNAPTPVAKFLDTPAWVWDNTGLGITASGTSHIGIGAGRAVSYNGFQSPVTNNPDGLALSTAGRSWLRQHNGGSELLIDSKLATGAAQLSWKANSAATTRSLGIDYTSGSLEFGTNAADMSSWMYQITPSVEITDLGNVGIGTNAATVRAKMEVNGGLKIGADTTTCSIMHIGVMRYSGGGNVFEYCNGTAWVGL